MQVKLNKINSGYSNFNFSNSKIKKIKCSHFWKRTKDFKSHKNFKGIFTFIFQEINDLYNPKQNFELVFQLDM